MIRGMVLGEFWGIERDEWIELWAGLLGAVPASIISAVVAAFVAMFVLSQSSKYQKDLADEQLDEQRKEAGQVRARAVMADLLGAANGFSVAADTGSEAVEAQRVLFQTNAYRWAFENESNAEHALELWTWTITLWKPAWFLTMAKDAPESSRVQWRSFLSDATAEFTTLGITLVSASDLARAEFQPFVAKKRAELEARWNKEMENLPRSEEGVSATLSRS